MKIEKLETIIAIRNYALTDGTAVVVSIGKPEPFPDNQNYYCPYQITGIKRARFSYAAGVDAFQALMLTFEKIGIELYTSAEYKAGELTLWDHKNLCLPLADSCKHLLPPSE